MLVLSRKPGQTLVIGNITITFKSVRRGEVRVAIEAPKEVVILRGELEKREAA